MDSFDQPWKRNKNREPKTPIENGSGHNRYGKFLDQCAKLGLPKPIEEHRFHSERKWRFDFAWPEHMVAVEIEGGGWVAGRHSRGKGFHADMAKYGEAFVAGWMILRVPPDWIRDGRAVRYVRKWFDRFVD